MEEATMERVALKAEVREQAGKGVARSLRRAQRIPAVLYGHGNNLSISVVGKDVTKILNTEGGEHAVINLTVEGGKGAGEKLALIKDYQVDPLSGSLMHLDLMEVAMDEKVRVEVAIHLTGQCIGVKEGGILQNALRQVEVECFPNQIPDAFNFDISSLKVNESIHVRDLKPAEGVRILTDGDATIVTIQPPISAEKLESMLTATPAVTEGEPELVKKAKAGEGEAAAAGAKGKEAAPAKEAAPKK